MKVYFSRESDEWTTPQKLFDLVNKEFGFTLDAAATKENTKCKEYLTDALNSQWSGTVWLNPPYSRIAEFVEKAYLESKSRGTVVVMLIPSRTDTKYWHDYVMHASEIRFIRGRLKFGSATCGAPFPSALIVFGKTHGLSVSSMGRE